MLRVANWHDHFENNRTRDIKKMAWVPVPTKMDGDGYTELLDHPNGAAHYGAWIACVLVAGKSHPRGTLVRGGKRDHDSASLSRMTRISQSVFEEAIPRLISVGWLEEVIDSKEDATTCGAPAAQPHLPAAAPQPCSVVLCSSLSSKKGESEGKEAESAKEKRAGYGLFFEDFWRAVAPHKRDKKAEAARRYKEAIAILGKRPDVADPHKWLRAKAEAYYTSPLGLTPYCNGPAPWLHQGGYDADPAAWQRRDNRPAEPEEPSAPFVGYDYDAYLESQKLEPKVKP